MSKKQKRKSKSKHKKNKWEKLFIEEYGIETYERLLNELPELKRNRKYFQSLFKLAPYFNLESAHDGILLL